MSIGKLWGLNRMIDCAAVLLAGLISAFFAEFESGAANILAALNSFGIDLVVYTESLSFSNYETYRF